MLADISFDFTFTVTVPWLILRSMLMMKLLYGVGISNLMWFAESPNSTKS